MNIEKFIEIINLDFFAGVPDSQLRPLCDYLMDKYGIDTAHHIIGVNEGNCVGLAAGYNLATGKIPVVYMQNSGEGNALNPIASLLNDNVYGIPCVFVIGWRGEPGIHDEPQHVYQGKITLNFLDMLDISYMVIDSDTNENEVWNKYNEFKKLLEKGKQVAFVIRKNALTSSGKYSYVNDYKLQREEVIRKVLEYSKEDIVVSTTGKASRELFEIREENKQSHKYDFLTVGSMGHSSSIALSIANMRPNKRVWVIDGDGAVLMHMGAMAIIGATKPNNYIHIVINNAAHETVGGMETVAGKIDICKIAEACGYEYVKSVSNMKSFEKALDDVAICKKLSLIEVKCSIGSRKNLGRPTTTPIENKEVFINWLRR